MSRLYHDKTKVSVSDVGPVAPDGQIKVRGMDDVPPVEPVDPPPAPVETRVKSYLEKVSSIVPAEIVAGYLAMVGFLDRDANGGLVANQGLLKGVFVFCLILTPIYFYFQAQKDKPKVIHIVMSTIAFVVWALVTSGEKYDISFYTAEMASIILVGFSLISGLIPMKK